jgi:phage-related holin
MKYIIMFLIVVGLAGVDFITGLIKAIVNDNIISAKMKKGGLAKVAEIIVMVAVIGLDIGLEMIGEYYQNPKLTAFAGSITAIIVFTYITIMEVISVLENYAAINPEAAWVGKITKKLKNIEYLEGKDDSDEED